MTMRSEDGVRQALEPAVYDCLLEKFDSGCIDSSQTQNIADMMDKSVGGHYRRAAGTGKFKLDRTAFRQVFSDWNQYRSE